MKKFSILCGVALALGFSACDDALPNPQPQVNPQPEIFDSANLTLSQGEYGVNQPVDLQALYAAGEKAVLADITDMTGFPTDYDLIFKVEMATSDKFDKTVTIDVPVENEQAAVPAATINSAIYDTFTHDPAQIKIYTRWAAYAVSGTSTMRIGGKDKLYAEYTYDFVPFAPDRVLSTAYSLKYRASASDAWSYMNFSKAVEGSVYDDGTFAAQVQIDQPGFEWMVVPTANIESQEGLMGVAAADAEAAQGALVEGEAAQANVINVSNLPYLISIDVINMTYRTSVAFANLWAPGQLSGTSNFSKVLKLFTTDFVHYTATLPLATNWYITAQAANDGVVYMLDGDQKESEDGVYSGALKQLEGATGNKMTITSGLYYVDVNLGTLTYTATLIPSIQVIGAFNGWDLETAPELTANARKTTWTIKDLEMTAGEYKFCVDHDWALSYGAALDDLQQNGGNLKLDEDGKYDITLDFSKQPNTVTIVKK